MTRAIAILGGGLLLLLLFFAFVPAILNITQTTNATTNGTMVTVANGTVIDTSGENVAHYYFGYSNFMIAFPLICFGAIIAYVGILLWRNRTGQL
jgi:hypothetical protein